MLIACKWRYQMGEVVTCLGLDLKGPSGAPGARIQVSIWMVKVLHLPMHQLWWLAPWVSGWHLALVYATTDAMVQSSKKELGPVPGTPDKASITLDVTIMNSNPNPMHHHDFSHLLSISAHGPWPYKSTTMKYRVGIVIWQGRVSVGVSLYQWTK